MDAVLMGVAIAEMLVILLVMVRLARGPSVGDRIVAVNSMATSCAVVVMVYAVIAGRSFEADVAIWLASFSYLGALVWARYLERGLL